ncbi:MAG: NADH-quinone oxidoreductase subunit N [Candidatus Kaistia colombiensis]|nr:MAG: NADH-quinone oxidoreductase subunit N [Kaistia sp.]
MLAGLAFKVSAVPFHMWTPDVYEGAPTPVTPFFAVRPEGRGHGAVHPRARRSPRPGRLGVAADDHLHRASPRWSLGAFAAIGQRNIKRLMAYSSIGHMGFALVGLAAGTPGRRAGRAGLHRDLCRHDARRLRGHPVHAPQGPGGRGDQSTLAGLSRTNPVIAFIFAMILFSLAGIPPLAGFFAKFYVFLAAIEGGISTSSRVIGVLSSVVGAYYYLRIVKIMYFDEPAGAFEPMSGELRFVLGLSGLFVMLFVFIAGPLGAAATVAAKTFF